VKSFTYQIL
jgi:serine/threonine protein kinase